MHTFTETELIGKIIEITGCGNVGHRVAFYTKDFDMEVLAFDLYISDKLLDRHHGKYLARTN